MPVEKKVMIASLEMEKGFEIRQVTTLKISMNTYLNEFPNSLWSNKDITGSATLTCRRSALKGNELVTSSSYKQEIKGFPLLPGKISRELR